MSLSEDLLWRGLIKDKTFDDNSWLDEPKVFYHGVDPTADSLTVGNLAALMLARRLIDAGWKAILLVGGATSLVGDPGGKTQERQLMTREQILKNAEVIKAQVSKLFEGKEFIPADNYEWLPDLKYLDFLRDVGKSFSMTELIQRDFVKERMGEGGSGISYAEFSYSLIQGYDYWQLYKNHQAELQIGGSDQWGNMLSGVALIRKKEGKEAHALSMPLVVNKETGQKFGKSEAGAIWLDAQKTPPTDFYQFWINTDDNDVEDYLKVFTLLPKEQIVEAINEHSADPPQRKAQKLLASEVQKIIHGEGLLAEAENHADMIKNAAVSGADSAVRLKSGISLADALVETGLSSSKTEARRLIDSGGVYIDNVKSQQEKLDSADFPAGRLLLRRGKAYKDSSLVELE